MRKVEETIEEVKNERAVIDDQALQNASLKEKLRDTVDTL
jgi:hypothetical protein